MQIFHRNNKKHMLNRHVTFLPTSNLNSKPLGHSSISQTKVARPLFFNKDSTEHMSLAYFKKKNEEVYHVGFLSCFLDFVCLFVLMIAMEFIVTQTTPQTISCEYWVQQRNF